MTARKHVTTLFPAALVLILLCSCGSMSRPVPSSALGMELTPQDSATVSRSAPSASQFNVVFKGIIMHARFSLDSKAPDQERAIIIEGTPAMFHRPTLYVPPSVDVTRLRDVTGQPVFCTATECSVLIDDISMRVSGKSGASRQGPPERLERFNCLVPHMRDDPNINPTLNLDPKDRMELKRSVTAPGLPGSFVSGFFELDSGGTLDACPFQDPGHFFRKGAVKTEGPARHFAGLVQWSGSTDGDAILEIHSRQTNGEFVEIPIAHDGVPLEIRVENFPPGVHYASPKHFALNSRVLMNPNLPEVEYAPDPRDHCQDCGFQPKMSVPGCSDTGWP